MLRKILVLFLCLGFVYTPLYAESPFGESDVSLEASDENIDTATVSTEEKEKKDEEVKSVFPITGRIEAGKLRLRDWPWGPVSGKYDKGTYITVLGVDGEFYEVIILGKKGYVHKNYVSIPGVDASLEEPNYPGDTKSGGSLSKEKGTAISNGTYKGDDEEDKTDDSGKSDETFKSVKKGISAEDFKKELDSMKTPTREEIIKAAATIGVSEDYVKLLIGTTQREGYFKDPYLHYGWASAMLNQKVTIKQMQGWDPKHKGESNYYSQTNINKGYKEAKGDVLKSVYLALKYRNTKIIECNGMYKNTPSSYNRIYKSSVYNCSIFEKK